MTYWLQAPLREVCRSVGGGTPSKSRAEFWHGNIPWVSPKDMVSREIYDAEDHISDVAVTQSATQIVPSGSVLIVVRSGILVRRLPVALARVPVALNQDMKAFLPGELLLPDFLAYGLEACEQRILQHYVKRGATVHSVDMGKLLEIHLPIPAPSEQRRIVEILDQAQSLRNRRAEADKKAERILPTLFIKMFGDPATNPRKWPLQAIRDQVQPIERRDPSLDPETTFIYVDIAGVDGVRGEIVETKRLQGQDAPSRARQVIREKDVLISTVRPYLRATALVPTNLDGQIASTGFCVLRSKADFGHGYLYAVSRLQWFTDQLNARARGASYPAVTDSDILGLRIPAPTNQVAMHEFNQQLDELVHINRERVRTAQRLEALFSSLLHGAFSGHLTAKWREAHMKELLAEMEQQAKLLNLPPPSVERLTTEA